MGDQTTCCACENRDEISREVSRQIDHVIRRDREILRRQIKLLLLGTGEAGKSTLIKQMKILHSNGYRDDERARIVGRVHSNILESILILVQAMHFLAMQFANDESHAKYQMIQDLDYLDKSLLDNESLLEPKILEVIYDLWRDSSIQQVFNQRSKTQFQLSDSTEYFMDRIPDINTPNYLPTNDDIIRVRIRTTAIEEHTFEIEKATFRIIDVGGQRTERRKWIFCFENVTAIFFIASLSEFDQTLAESGGDPRMAESIELFRVIINNGNNDEYLGVWFRKAAIILFLNKTDILREKLKDPNLHLHDSLIFEDYTGPNRDVEQVQNHILQKYLRCRRDPSRPIFDHYTCAVDTKNVEFVFNAVRLSVLLEALRDFSPF